MNRNANLVVRIRTAVMTTAIWLTSALGSAYAQAAPPPPPPIWAGNFGAGFALTSGNADTRTFNLAFAVTHDPMNPHVWKADALYLRGSNEGTTNVNRSTFGIRDDYAFTARTSVYGQFRYLRDTFKQIDYLMAPTAGVAQKIIISPRLLLAADAGAGMVVEKNPGVDADTSGALTVGENFSFKLSDTATVTQQVSSLWKTSDFSDTLVTLGAGLAANITPRTILKVEILEIFKNLPPPGVQKQDVSFITSFVYTFERR